MLTNLKIFIFLSEVGEMSNVMEAELEALMLTRFEGNIANDSCGILYWHRTEAKTKVYGKSSVSGLAVLTEISLVGCKDLFCVYLNIRP